MPYPLSVKGRALSELTDEASTLARLELVLKDVHAKKVKRDGEAIRFEGNFMSRSYGAGVLAVISWGRLKVSRTDKGVQVEYELNFLRHHLMRAGIAAGAFGAIAAGMRSVDPLKMAAGALILWVLLVSLDFLMAASLFPSFLSANLRK